MTTDRIRVLLIDDEPLALQARLGDVLTAFPDSNIDENEKTCVPFIRDCLTLPPDQRHLRRSWLHEDFELRWLATASESREFRDLSENIGVRFPQALGADGWVPEIVIFDYALSSHTKTVADRIPVTEVSRQLSPLPKLRELYERLFGKQSTYSVEEKDVPPPPTGTGFDNMGCFAGGLIVGSFANHFCVPIPTTAKGTPEQRKTLDSEAGFYEWMLENSYPNAFESAGRTDATWNGLLVAAADPLRQRIKIMIGSGMVRPDLHDLLDMSADDESRPVSTLNLRSRYGRRKIPIRGLFLDQIDDYGKLPPAIATWATGILRTEIGLGPDRSEDDDGEIDTISNLEAAIELETGLAFADRLWDAYESEAVDRREELSFLVAARNSGSTYDAERFDALLSEFGIDQHDIDKSASAKCTENVFDLRSGEYSDESRRWAVFFVVIKLFHERFTRAKEIMKSESDLEHSTDLRRLLPEINTDDIHLALYPLPSTPLVLPWHSGATPESRWKDLKRLGEKGALRISIRDVLRYHGWDGIKNFGIKENERLVLSLYAESLYGSTDWREDPQLSQVLEPTQ